VSWLWRHAVKAPTTPKRLILIRHGESEGNVDHHIYETVADGQLHLTEEGWKQARCAGKALKRIVGDEPVKFMVSPYVRTRETLNAVVEPWGTLANVDWYEDPRIREQDFGNFQDVEAVQKAKKERANFGPFFYRMTNGESPSDVYDRLSSFFESMYRDWDRFPLEEVKNLNYVIVCHGITIACFLMRLFKYSVDDFHNYQNFSNAEFCVLDRGVNDKYSLERLYCVKQKLQKDGSYRPEEGPRSLYPDVGRLDRAIRTCPPSEQAPSLSRTPTPDDECKVITFQADLRIGVRCDWTNLVESIIPGSQADALGVTPGWYLTEVNSEMVAEGCAKEAVEAALATTKSFSMQFRIPRNS